MTNFFQTIIQSGKQYYIYINIKIFDLVYNMYIYKCTLVFKLKFGLFFVNVRKKSQNLKLKKD